MVFSADPERGVFEGGFLLSGISILGGFRSVDSRGNFLSIRRLLTIPPATPAIRRDNIPGVNPVRSSILGFLFVLLAGFAGYLVFQRMDRDVKGGTGAPASSPGGAEARPAGRNELPPAPTPGIAEGVANLPAAPDPVQKAIADAGYAASRGDLLQQARALTIGLNAALQKPGTSGWEQARPIVEALREVNEKLWFTPARSERSAQAAPAPLSKIVTNLGRQTPPVRVGVGFIAKMNRLKNINIVPGGVQLRVPTDSLSIVVRRQSFSLVVYLGEFAIEAFPVGIGRPSLPSPAGNFEIIEIQHLDEFKREATKWVRPEDGKELYYGDSEYPFGKRFLRFAAPFDHYGIHGTDTDAAIGAAISHGCIRMRNADVEALAAILDTKSAPKYAMTIE